MKKLALLAIVLIAAGCASTNNGPMAMATLAPTTGQTATGTVHLTQLKDGGVEVKVDLTNVPPGVHGFHIHEGASCGNDAKDAGGHYNPTNMPHAAPDAASHHAGDFGNVTAGENGEVHATFVTHSITVTAGPTSAIGHALVLHGGADDLTTQPSGNSGARIACGVVQEMAGSMQH
jgi:Cu-Zn family superoxide dismutase